MVPDRNPDLGLRFSFFLIETLSITGQKFSRCLKNGSDRLRKGQLLRLQLRLGREYKVEGQTKMTRNTTLSGLLNHDINQLVIEKST